MRNLTKIIAVVFLVTVAAATNAQTPKFGHIELQALVQVMPERAAAETEFNAFQADLQDVMDELQSNYQTLLTELEGMGAEVSEVRRNAKITELQDLEQRIQNYSQSAQQQMQQKQAELLNPVFTKAEEAIEEVAKEQGLIYVFDVGSGAVLYQSNQSVDVLPLVKQKLGLE